MSDEPDDPTPSSHLKVGRREVIQGLNASWLAGGLSPLLSASGANAGAAPGDSPSATGKVREIENTWVAMPDGVKLAARLWIPEGAENNPVPALFNYSPYFARFFTRPEDDARFPYYAARGYACVRVDTRGCGDSEGIPLDEYVRQEQDDGLEIIAWIARQAWCNGSVGMEGISWSGSSSLQMAARQPPALKAIITHCSTDDRYLDDAHFKGGCIVSDMFKRGTAFLALQGQAPDPAIVGKERWRERWLERLKKVDFHIGNWMLHPHRDAFWKHGSVIEDYSRITCPVYAIGGWADGYQNAVFRLLAGLKVPRKGLVGPWTQLYPHQGMPGPAIGYLEEAVRWWDHWLKGIDTGTMREPMLRAWSQQATPSPRLPIVPGRWIAERTWPSPRLTPSIFHLDPARGLVTDGAKAQRVQLLPSQTVGSAGGNWCPSGAGAARDLSIEMALDQRLDDARSLTFDTQPLAQPLEILGSAAVTLEISCDRPVAFLIVRLNDVAPTGESGRVCYGVLNLCHRDSHESPSPLIPGEHYTVNVPLDHTAYRFRPGNRIRLAISTTYWPMILPSPEAAALSVYTGDSRVALPVRPPRAEDSSLRPFGPPYVPPVAMSSAGSQPGSRRIEWDVASRTQVIQHRLSTDEARLDAIDTKLISESNMRCEIRDNDPASSMESEHSMGWARGEWAPRVVATSKVITSPGGFALTGKLEAYDGDKLIFTRSWEKAISRKLV